MRSLVSTALRSLQFLFIVLVTALVGDVIAGTKSDADGSHSQGAVNFLMFVAVLSWISMIYGMVTNFTALEIPIAELSLDAAATLFTCIGAIVVSAKLGVVKCSSLDDVDGSYIASGSGNPIHRCKELQASTVFLWLLFATFIGTLFIAFREFRRGGSIMSRPSMSQIGV